MEATENSQYQPISLTKQVHIDSINEDVEVRLHISSNVVKVCVNRPDIWKKILTAKTYHCSVTPGQQVGATFANLEEAYEAIVIQAYQDHIFPVYLQPKTPNGDEKQKRSGLADSNIAPLNEQYVRPSRDNKQENRNRTTPEQYQRKQVEREQETQKQKHGELLLEALERARPLRQQLIEKYKEETRFKKEVEDRIRLQIEEQVSNLQVSLSQANIQQASIRIAGDVSELMLKFHLPVSLTKDMLSSCRLQLKSCQTFREVQGQSELSQDWLNQLRHEQTNYDAIISQLKRSNQHSEAIHNLVRSAINDLINLVWKRRILPLLELEIAEATAEAEQILVRQEAKRQEELQAEQERQQAELRKQEEQSYRNKFLMRGYRIRKEMKQLEDFPELEVYRSALEQEHQVQIYFERQELINLYSLELELQKANEREAI